MVLRRLFGPACLICLVAAGSLFAQEPLGDVARRLREERSRLGLKPVKVYTNDNLPPKPPWESETVSSMSSAPAVTAAVKVPPAAGKNEGGAPQTAEPSQEKEENAADKMKTKEYWQGRFQATREHLARVKEEEDLDQNELQLLQVQLARELNANAQNDLKQKIGAKQSELEEAKALTAEAEKTLEKLEKEFKESGAPEDWSKPY